MVALCVMVVRLVKDFKWKSNFVEKNQMTTG